ncbi:heparinase II/III family protein [Kiritimatiellaeota bacterium B1221]|nr:heparinase II/III family protein [Kiritimatiellaeota bacterium B1221]
MRFLHISSLFISLTSFHLHASSLQVTQAMKSLSPSHPRLFLSADQEDAWRKKISSSLFLQPLAEKVISDAHSVLDLPPVERIVTGRRLLDISRIALKRIGYLSFAYRLTGETKYAERAIEEMRAIANFTDWNPSHFLDVAEMTTAMAIGYDWLYPVIGEADRALIVNAVLEKGLRPSMPPANNGKEPGFVTTDNNWNQVCNTGMTLGALAIYEEAPALAETILQRAVNSLPRVLKTYAPDGAYVEGPIYWAYGTTYNILFFDAVQQAFGSDFGLSKMPGFMESADYMQHIKGPSGDYFNYADSVEHAGINPGLYWMAQQQKKPSLLWNEVNLIGKYLESDVNMQNHSKRFMPFLLLWAPAQPEQIKPSLTHWKADGEMPVAFYRSGWDTDDTYAAIKGGSPSLNHAHMDAGSFVLEINGVRWALDLGMENYHKAESAGMILWMREQASERWEIFRIGSFSHNILTVNGQQQRVDGHANILKSDESATTVDLSTIYRGQLASTHRKIQLIETGKVIIEDQLRTLNQPTQIRWAMLTHAQVDLSHPQGPVLKQDNQLLQLQLNGLEDVTWQVSEVSDPPQEWERKNPNTRMLYFEQDLPPESEITYTVKFLASPQALKFFKD